MYWIKPAGLDPLDRVNAAIAPIERSDIADSGALGTGDEACLREVDPVELVLARDLLFGRA